MFEKLKQKIRTKRPEDPYDVEERRIHEYLSRLELGTPEFKDAQDQLKMVNENRKGSYESRKHLTISDRGGIIKKVIGGGITLGGVILLGRYEAKGQMFTGEKKPFADGLVKVFCRIFGGGD